MKSVFGNHKHFGVVILGLAVALALAAPSGLLAQRIDGDLTGIVTDPSGAVVQGAKVKVTNEGTGQTRETTTTSVGKYFFANLLPGRYTLEVELSGFKLTRLTGIEVQGNRLSEANTALEVGAAVETVVVEAGANTVTTTTATLVGATFRDELGKGVTATSLTGNPITLAITAPGTTTQSGGVTGEGGSIGGNRPRQNAFVIDGITNNSVSTTVNLTPVISEAISEFTLLTNQFTAEYGQSTAGQFLQTTKSGTNEIHGRGWLFVRNRHLNSFDNITRSTTPPGGERPKQDWQRYGGQAGGPIMKNRWFYFGAYERQELDESASSTGVITVPTAAGLSALQALASAAGSGVSPVNVGMIADNVPVAGARTGTRSVCNEALAPSPTACATAGAWQVPIEVGTFRGTTPNFAHVHLFTISSDYVGQKHRIAGRLSRSQTASVGAGTLPVVQFNNDSSPKTYRVSLGDYISYTPNVYGEVRVGYLRSDNSIPVPGLPPGPGNNDTFGNYNISDMSLNMGPQSNLPQKGITNIYQFTKNVSWVRGAHTWRMGGEYRKIIAQSGFLPRARGDYNWSANTAIGTINSLDGFVRDTFPNTVSIRGVGTGEFAQDRDGIFAFVQDSWRVTPRVVLELGIRYEFATVARGEELQNLNGLANAVSLGGEVWNAANITAVCGGAAASRAYCANAVAGQNIFGGLPAHFQQAIAAHVGNSVIFKEPRSDKNNWAPRVGFAWDVRGDGKWSLRGGAAKATDVYFGNLALLQLPPQAQAESREGGTACSVSPRPDWCANVAAGGERASPLIRFSQIGFIEGGAIFPILPAATSTNALLARALTGNFVPHQQKVPETLTWSLSLQHQLTNRMVAEARYVGTRGLRLPIQRHLNPPPNSLFRIPVFASTSEIPTSFAGQPTLANFNNNNRRMLEPWGFLGAMTLFEPAGRSTYHGGSASLRGEVGWGLFLNTSYTWSKVIDNIENELFTSVMNPRRPENHIDPFTNEFAKSGLNHEHKYVASWSWDIPHGGASGAWRKVVGGWNLAGTYIFETGQPITILANVDTIGSGDAASARAFFNPAGVGNTGSGVSTVCWQGGVVIVGTCTSSATTVGYVAKNSSAAYIEPGTGGFAAGSLSPLGRNTFTTESLNNWNVSISKTTPFWGEGRTIRFQADFVNLFNHPQLVLGSGSVFVRTAVATGRPGYVSPSSAQFLDETGLSGGLGNAPYQRLIQLSLKVNF
ncbi:MAG: carboxypeptidase regulatory-like domain-containing protein [Candidatus Acidiferrales bacterium]